MSQNEPSFKDTALNSLVDLTIHLAYLLFFYLFSQIFTTSEFINSSIKSAFSNANSLNLGFSILITFAFIGATFCFAVIFEKKLSKSHLEVTKSIFQFGVDYLYFIYITISTLCLISFVSSIRGDVTYYLHLGFGSFTLLVSYVLRLMYHSFEIKHLKFLYPNETQETAKD